MSAQSTVFLLGLGLVFVSVYAPQRLWHTDLWDHANYGKYILANGIPDTEPLLELAKGTPFVATAWLSQVGMALLLKMSALGPAALQFVHATLVATAMAAVGFAVYRKRRSVVLAIVAYSVFVAVNWQQLMIIRPQLAGVTFFCVLAAALNFGRTMKRSMLLIVPLLILVWANCHGSFAMGLMLIGLTAAGRHLDVLVRTKSFRPLTFSHQTQRLLMLLLLCLVAASINPFGIKIFPEVARVGSHPNIKTMFEWDAMSLSMKQGRAMAVAVVALGVLMWLTPRRITIEECLRLLVTGGLAIWSSRMINWFAPVVAISIGVHGHAVARNFRDCFRTKGATISVAASKRTQWTVVNVALVVICIGCTPFGKQVLGLERPTIRSSLSKQTPVELAEYLASSTDLSDGLTFVPAEWTGYIMHAAPDRIRPFVNLHVHVIPEAIWADYVSVVQRPSEAESTLAKYDIQTVVTDKWRQKGLIQQLDRSPGFHRSYEDHHAIIFQH